MTASDGAAPISSVRFDRRRFLSGVGAGAMCVALGAPPALAAFPPKSFIDPGDLARRYLDFGPMQAPGEIEILGYRIDLREAAVELLGLLAEGIKTFKQSDPFAEGPPLYTGKIPDTGSAVVNGVLTAVATANPVAGIAAAVIDMDVKLNEINAKLDVVNAKLDRVLADIAALREQVNDDAVLRDLKRDRAEVNAHISSFRLAKGNMGWRLANLAKAKAAQAEAQAAATAAETAIKEARGRNAKQSAKKEASTAKAHADKLLKKYLSEMNNSAKHARNDYIPELRRLEPVLREKVVALMNYTIDEERAQLSLVAPVIAMALATLKAIHVELGRQERDFDPVVAEFDRWTEFAKSAGSGRTISRAANKYDVYRLQHEQAAGGYCPGLFVGAIPGRNKSQDIHIAYAEIRRKTRRNLQLDKIEFGIGVFWWASLKRGGDKLARATIKLNVSPYRDEAAYNALLPDYQSNTCQKTSVDRIDVYDPDEALEDLKQNPEKRSRLRQSFEQFRLWRAHVFAADDARAERHYLESLTDLLDQSLDLART